jgi:hypothetical protein
MLRGGFWGVHDGHNMARIVDVTLETNIFSTFWTANISFFGVQNM